MTMMRNKRGDDVSDKNSIDELRRHVRYHAFKDPTIIEAAENALREARLEELYWMHNGGECRSLEEVRARAMVYVNEQIQERSPEKEIESLLPGVKAMRVTGENADAIHAWREALKE